MVRVLMKFDQEAKEEGEKFVSLRIVVINDSVLFQVLIVKKWHLLLFPLKEIHFTFGVFIDLLLYLRWLHEQWISLRLPGESLCWFHQSCSILYQFEWSNQKEDCWLQSQAIQVRQCQFWYIKYLKIWRKLG